MSLSSPRFLLFFSTGLHAFVPSVLLVHPMVARAARDNICY